jgi:hypothetical protein
MPRIQDRYWDTVPASARLDAWNVRELPAHGPGLRLSEIRRQHSKGIANSPSVTKWPHSHKQTHPRFGCFLTLKNFSQGHNLTSDAATDLYL